MFGAFVDDFNMSHFNTVKRGIGGWIIAGGFSVNLPILRHPA
jgi:hypothetical protein